LDRGDDARIAIAPAEVAVEAFDDLGFSRLGRLFEQGDGPEDHAWSAVAALHRAFLHKSLLNRVEGAIGLEAFDGADGPAGHGTDGSCAGDDRRAIEQDGAGAALTFAAAILGASDAEIFA
jgi:hypothetical protein